MCVTMIYGTGRACILSKIKIIFIDIPVLVNIKHHQKVVIVRQTAMGYDRWIDGLIK